MDRRDFIKVCSAGAAAVVAGVQVPFVYAGTATDYARTKLVDASGNALKASSLSQTEAYVFNYPFAGTPSFLISLPNAAPGGAALKTEAGDAYSAAAGVGAGKNVVAYLAVCTHQMAHPEKGGSTEMSYSAGNSEAAGRSAVITCCAHNSAFDPANGGAVLTGKASQPLVGVRLEHDAATDELYATGVYGADLVEDYFKKLKGKLNKEFGIGKYKEAASGSVQAVLLSKYSTDIDHC